MMTIAEMKADIAQLDALIAAQPEPRHRAEQLTLKKAQQRRQMLQAALRAEGKGED